jgi:predicted house-cleaning noncanonical NTP pyrophosphatase (MazG superfamily)
MKKFSHNTLWRDNLAEILIEEGAVVHIEQLDEDQYEEALRAKIVEESIEMLESSDQDEVMEGMADILEAMDALCKVYGIKMSEILEIKKEKHADLGGYNKTDLITDVEYPAGSEEEQYCLNHPDQYPQVDNQEESN